LLAGEEELQMGVNITVELVQSLVETWRADRAAEVSG
jgi:pyroglutamyl-peptidase